jgi:hypothetical protein
MICMCTWVKDSCYATDHMTVTHTTVKHLTYRVEALGHKLFMNNFFSSPRLSDDVRDNKHKLMW